MHGIEQAGSTLTSEDRADYDGFSHIRQGTKGFISTSKRVLLVKERHTDGSSFWTLPGGGAEPDETLADCLARELFEELRCHSLIDQPLATIWYAHSSSQRTFSIYTVFECSLLSTPVPNNSEGICGYTWALPSNLPVSTLPQVRQLIQEYDLRRDPPI